MANLFLPNWRQVLARAWSMWAIAVSIVLSAGFSRTRPDALALLIH